MFLLIPTLFFCVSTCEGVCHTAPTSQNPEHGMKLDFRNSSITLDSRYSSHLASVNENTPKMSTSMNPTNESLRPRHKKRMFTAPLGVLQRNVSRTKRLSALNQDHYAKDIASQDDLFDHLQEHRYKTTRNKESYSTKSPRLYRQNKSLTKSKRFLGQGNPMAKVKHLMSGGWSLSTKEAKKIFEAYYACLEAKVASLQKEEFPIKAVLALEGEKVILTCHVCYRPDQDKTSQRATWQFLRHEDSALTHVVSGKHIRVKKDHSLIIRSVEVKDAGQYFCVERQDYAAVWQVDVFLADKRRFIQFGVESPQPEAILWRRNLRVFTMWAPWSECNACDRPGQRSRVGQCMVKKLYPDIPIFPRDYPMMALYPSGVPCHSTALPRHVRRSRDIGKRESETLVSPCLEKCPTEPPIRTVTDDTGKVLEVLEPGFYSMGQKPKLPKMVKRRVLYEEEKSHLVLKCPGDLEASQVRWTRGQREVDPTLIRRQTAGRVWLDQLSRLHIDPLLLTDTAVYNCFVKTRRVASIKLLVVDAKGKELKLYISYAGLVATVVGGVALFCCLCCKKTDKNAQ